MPIESETGYFFYYSHLHVNVEDADLSLLKDGLDCGLAGTVHVAGELGVFDELRVADGSLHRVPRDEVVVDAVLLALSAPRKKRKK